MDDPGNGPYSRAPELEDLLNLCRALNEEGVRYCLIGGFAVILHGYRDDARRSYCGPERTPRRHSPAPTRPRVNQPHRSPGGHESGGIR